MGYHDRCFDDVPYLKSKDPSHNNKRDKLTENAVKRYAETNPEYQKVIDKYYRPDKKLPRASVNKETAKSNSNKNAALSTAAPMCSDSRCSTVSNSSEKLCPNCRQKFQTSNKKDSGSKESKTISNGDSSVTYWKTKIDDDHQPTFPPKYPNECTSLILPAMFTEEERKYYQSKQKKYPPAEKVSSILESHSPIRSKPTGPYNIITGEELYETA